VNYSDGQLCDLEALGSRVATKCESRAYLYSFAKNQLTNYRVAVHARGIISPHLSGNAQAQAIRPIAFLAVTLTDSGQPLTNNVNAMH
jgi:hypothetical protein